MASGDKMLTQFNNEGVKEVWAVKVDEEVIPIAGGDGAAERERKDNEAIRVENERSRASDETARADAETARAAAELERAAQQVKNNADQTANNAAAQGLQVVKLNEGQFDPDTLMPTVSGEVGKLYFVPIPSQTMSALASIMEVDGASQDSYLEWMSIDGKWERVGMSNATLVSLTTDEIDRIAAGEQVASESVLGGTGLTYLWTKLKTAFAAIAHKHVTGDVTGLDSALGDKATKAELKTVQDSLDQAFIPRGVNPGGVNFDYVATKQGVYWVNNGVTGGTYPDGASYGILAVFKTPNDVMQLFSYEMGLWHRMNVNDRWCPWQKLN